MKKKKNALAKNRREADLISHSVANNMKMKVSCSKY